MTTYDCIVIGLGGFGSSTLMHLADRGLHVLGLEQYSPVHDRGSSHGRTRIIRKAYFEHPDYVPLLRTAYDLWHELECRTGQSLYVPSGLILSGPAQGDTIAGARQAAHDHDLPLEEMTASEARTRFPSFQFPDDHQILREEDAGYLQVEECVRAQLNVAAQRGATTCFQESVQSWQSNGRHVRVVTNHGEYAATSLVLASGAWSAQLVGDVLPPLRVLRKIQFWHGLNGPDADAFRRIPAFLFELPGGTFYGFPSLDGRTIKIAEHSGGTLTADPAALDRECHEEDRRPLREFVRDRLRGVSPEASEHAPCMYTMSPDGHFIIDRHPLFPNVVIAAGFSGHGFKFTSVIGAALADLAMAGKTQHPIEFLNLKRFRREQHR